MACRPDLHHLPKAPADTTWTPVNSLTDTHFAVGGIGFRTGCTERPRSAACGIANAADDTALRGNDFPTRQRDFSGCGTVTGGP